MVTAQVISGIYVLSGLSLVHKIPTKSTPISSNGLELVSLIQYSLSPHEL